MAPTYDELLGRINKLEIALATMQTKLATTEARLAELADRNAELTAALVTKDAELTAALVTNDKLIAALVTKDAELASMQNHLYSAQERCVQQQRIQYSCREEIRLFSRYVS
jgi:chromosome segregation ATPase